MTYVFIYLLVINIVACVVMYMDKERAKKKVYRISERTLWQLAFIGGALGAVIGMEWFRHKTKHIAFKWGLPFLALIEMGIITYYILK